MLIPATVLIKIFGYLLMFKRIIVAASFALFAVNAHALPFTNGSFENLGGQSLQHGNWGYFPSMPGWTGVDNIEIHLGNGGNTFVTPADGKYYAELNAHPAQSGSFELHQTFDTVIGQTYSLDFYAQKRKHGDGSFSFSVGDIVSTAISDHIKGQWTKYSFLFTATGATSTLGFLSGQGGNDTVGHYLDNISVTAVPEPGVLALFAMGILGVFASRRWKRVQ